MAAKLTYEELELRIDELERKAFGHKLSEEALQASAGFLDTLVSSVSDGVVVYDDKFRYKLWNKFMEKLTGMRAENVLGKIAFDLFPHLREEGIDKLLERALAGETVQSGDTLYNVPDTGKVGWVTGLYNPHVDPSGNIVGVVAIVHDISDRKRAEDMLRESEERHRLLLEVSPDPIVLYGIEGKTIYVNPAFEKTFGWSLDELREKRIDFVPEENWQETKEAINRMLQGLKIQLFETRRLTKDGRILNIQLSSSLFFDRDEKPAGNIVILRDVTAQKRAEETLRKAHDELEQRVKERTAELVLINENLKQEIVDRQHAEAELIKSKAMFKAVVESLPFDVFVLDPSNRYVLQNSICKKNWGDVIGKSPEDLPVNKKTKYLWMDNNRRALSGETVTGEVVYDRLDGGKNFYYNIIAPICDGKKILGIVGVLVDISDLKQAEELLRESKERFRNLTEITSDWIWEVDKNGFYTYVSPKIQDILGYEPEEIIGKTPFDLMPPAEANRVSKIFNSIVASQKTFDCLENLNLHKNSHPVVLETSGIPTFDIDGAFRGYRGIDRDITGRKQVEVALRESEERYRSLAENSLVGFWQITLEGYTTYINPAMCSMLEIEGPEALSGQTYHPFFTTESLEIIEHERAKRPEGRGSCYEVEIIGKNGGRHNMMICGAPLLSTEGKLHGYIATFTDITDRKRAEKALQKAHDELERRVKERTRDLEIKTKSLEEINIALEVLLRKREEDKIDIEDNVLTNVKELIVPYFEKIKKTKLDNQQESFLSIIESYLNEIISPFTRKMSLKYLNLTPTEIQIANLIRHGSHTKKIAEILNVSPRTVETHRKNIRRKIGLGGKRANLRSHLLSLH